MYLSNRKKGFTLYELTIVLAIIAIVGTLVVSFVTFLSRYSNTVKEDNAAMNEIYTYKVMVEKWFSYFDTEEYKFEDTDNKLTAKGTTEYSVAYDGDSGYIAFLYIANGEYGTYNGETGYNELKITATSITSLTFENYGGSSGDDNLWRCTVGCDSGNVTFLLERHVGYSSSQ